jgi:FdrA protein
MPIRTRILASFYQDSVVLMHAASEVRLLPGVREAAAFMGTPANHALLEQIGLSSDASRRARADDLILVVDADTDAAAETALAAARERLAARRQEADQAAEARPRTLDSALRLLPRANLVAISVPGAYAKFEAMRALKRGLHVFLFSDHVPIEDEVELKEEALRRRRLCMGPDCGTAYLSGAGLGFSNLVPRGRIGLVAASGTGLQAVACRLAALGEGISHGIGVGGRDLSAEVAGRMSCFALEVLSSDASTEAIVLVSKPPHPEVLPRLEAALAGLSKPAVVCCLGAPARPGGRVRWVDTLDGAAEAVVAALQGREWSPRPFQDPGNVAARLARLRRQGTPAGSDILGLFSGGTLAHEARLILDPLLGPVGHDEAPERHSQGHRILDLGDDRYTVGRPHPMLDPLLRAERVTAAGRFPRLGVLLLDLVLGRGAHPDPAQPLVRAWRQARTAAEPECRPLVAVASVVGTAQDPQGLDRQVGQLTEAGVEVLPTNAEAARFAALLVRPDLESALLPPCSR